MQGKFVKYLSLLLVLNLLIKPFWILGIDRSVQNAVGAGEYGMYFALFNFSFLFNILLDLGITNFNNKNISQNNYLLTKYLSNILVLKFVLFGLYLVVTLTIALFVNYSQEQLNLLYILTFNQFLSSFILYLRSNLGGLHLFRSDSFISVLDKTLMIIICAVLLWGNVVSEFRIQYFIYAQTAGYLLSAVITFLLVFGRTSKPDLRLIWNFPFLLAIIRQSFPYALLVLLMTFHNRIDSVMLERMLPDGASYSGIYAAAYRLLDAANMIPYLFAVLLLPIFARMIKQKQDVIPLVRLAFTLLIVPAVIVAVVSFTYAEQIMTLLYPVHHAETQADFAFRIMESSRVFGLLMVCFMAISTTYIIGTLLTANGSLRHLNIVATMGVLLNIVLNLVLIPRYLSTGSAVATLITQLAIACVQLVLLRRLFSFQVQILFVLRIMVFMALTGLMGVLSLQSPFDWKINVLAITAASLLLAMLLKVLRPGFIYQLIRYGDV